MITSNKYKDLCNLKFRWKLSLQFLLTIFIEAVLPARKRLWKFNPTFHTKALYVGVVSRGSSFLGPRKETVFVHVCLFRYQSHKHGISHLVYQTLAFYWRFPLPFHKIFPQIPPILNFAGFHHQAEQRIRRFSLLPSQKMRSLVPPRKTPLSGKNESAMFANLPWRSCPSSSRGLRYRGQGRLLSIPSLFSSFPLLQGW